jgi:hypothetical protein
MFDKKAFQQICLGHFEFLIKQQPYASTFEHWEKTNLSKLIRTTTGYKRSANAKNKANTLQRFKDENKKNELIAEFLKLHGEPTRLRGISDDEAIAIFLDSYKTGKCKIESDIGLFIHLKVIQPAIVAKVLERLVKQEELIIKEPKINLSDYLHKDETVTINKIAEYIRQSVTSNTRIVESDTSEIIAYFIALTREYPKVLGAINGIEQIISSQTEKVFELRDNVSNIIPKEQTEYKVVVSGIKEIGTFYIANVIAVETLSGKLVPINKHLAEDLFPNRGSIFFPTTSLSVIPNKNLSFGCCVETSDRDGSNKFRFKSLWDDIYSVVECENGLENIEQLVAELKDFDLKSMPNDFWFMLPNGSLIKPKTKRLLILSASFQEPWWYVENTTANIFIREQGYITKAELSNKSTISMQSDESLLKSIKEAEAIDSDRAIPVEVLNRKPFLESYIQKSGANAEKIIRYLFEIFADSPSLESLLDSEKKRFLEVIDEEVKSAKALKEKTEIEVESINKKKSKLNSNIEEIESNISMRINTAIKKSKSDLIEIFDEPLVQLFLNSIGSKSDSNHQQVHFDSGSLLPLVETLNLSDLHKTIKLNGIKLEISFMQEKLFDSLALILSENSHIAFTGKLNSIFISCFLSYIGHSQYYFSKLLLADEVSETSKTMLKKRTAPLVVYPTSKVDLGIFRHELMISAELEGFAENPIVFCCDTIGNTFENIMYFDCDKLKNLTAEGMDSETFITEVGNEESSKRTKQILRKTNNQIREWYSYSDSDN